MRLNNQYIRAIRQYAKECFGNDSEVYLFGSRVQDNLKGGDIDLLIKTSRPGKELFDRKMDFLTKLNTTLGFQKIDVIVQQKYAKKKRDIVIIAENKGEKIC